MVDKDGKKEGKRGNQKKGYFLAEFSFGNEIYNRWPFWFVASAFIWNWCEMSVLAFVWSDEMGILAFVSVTLC